MGLFGGIASIITTGMTNKANAKEASKSRDFTKEQAQNSHQWEVADLRKAGLNPILSANGGASMGSSAQASMQAPNVDGLDTEGLASSALAYKSMKAQLDNVRADTQQKSSTDNVNKENLDTQKSQQAANVASAAAQASLANLYREQQRGQSLENDKQQVLKAGYDAAAPLVERLAGSLKNSASNINPKQMWNKFTSQNQKPRYNKIDWNKPHLKGKY